MSHLIILEESNIVEPAFFYRLLEISVVLKKFAILMINEGTYWVCITVLIVDISKTLIIHDFLIFDAELFKKAN